MFDEADVAMWCKLLGQAARERNPEKLAGILALIETAARAERNDLQRRSPRIAGRDRQRHSAAASVESHPWSTLLSSEDKLLPVDSNPSRNSELYLRYLRLADSALSVERIDGDRSKKKRRAA